MTITRNLHALKSGLAALLLAAPLTAPFASAQERFDARTPAASAEDPQITATKARYSFAEWTPGTARAGLALGRVLLPGLEGGALEDGVGARVNRRFEGAEDGSAVRVEMMVADTVADAQEQLIQALAFVSSQKTMPSLKAEDIEAGDVGFVGYSGAAPGRISWIAFVRGNVFLRVCCLDPRRSPHPDMGRIAQILSQEVDRARALGVGEELPRPIVQSLSAGQAQCVAGQSLSLELLARDPSDQGETTVIWRLEGEGQGYVEEDEPGLPRLYTTGAGTLRVVARVIGVFGTVREASTQVEVTPERD